MAALPVTRTIPTDDNDDTQHLQEEASEQEPFIVEPDTPLQTNCGSCELCLHACPTGALPNPYEIDLQSHIPKGFTVSTPPMQEYQPTTEGSQIPWIHDLPFRSFENSLSVNGKY